MATITGIGLNGEILTLLGIARRASRGVPAAAASPVTTLQAAIRAGLPYSALEAIARSIAIPAQRLAHIAAIAPRTLARRRIERTLSPDESDRIVRVARAYAHAKAVLGSAEKASAWLAVPNRSLGGHPPLDVLDTEVGAHLVEETLTQISYGMVG